MAGTTPSQGIPYAERPDPFELTADLKGSFNKIDSVFAQTRGESSAALTAASAAEIAAGQAVSRVNLIEEPIHVGPSAPTEGEELWVDTDAVATNPGGEVTAADITDASDVGRNVLTAPLSVDARNALSIFTGTRALLDAGTDTAERTWDAKELAEYVTDTAAAAGGAASWDDLTGKPTAFPPSAHNHDDRYYTEAEVNAEIAAAVGNHPMLYRSGARDIASTLLPDWTPRTSGVQIMRDGFTVTLVIDIARTGTDLTSFAEVVPIPAGFRPVQPGYIGPWSAGTVTGWWDRAAVEAALRLRDLAAPTGGAGTFAVGTRLRTTVSWATLDPIPETLPGDPV